MGVQYRDWRARGPTMNEKRSVVTVAFIKTKPTPLSSLEEKIKMEAI